VTFMNIRARARVFGALAAALALTSLGAQAQQYHGGGGPARPGMHFDARYGSNHYYAPRGAYYGSVPGHPYFVGGRYYYSSGVWYAPRGPGFVVIAPPVGVFVPVLPAYYTTLWVGGVPYYYANDTYYMWNAQQNGYAVVDPPSDPTLATTEAPPSDDLFIYPQNNQSAEQQSTDKYECHKWANSQTGYDPTQANGGVAPDQAADKRADYQRAIRACLEGRNYSVR
jgi:hypothetical protein